MRVYAVEHERARAEASEGEWKRAKPRASQGESKHERVKGE